MAPNILDKVYSTCTFAVGLGNHVEITTSLSLLTLTNIQTHHITDIILEAFRELNGFEMISQKEQLAGGPLMVILNRTQTAVRMSAFGVHWAVG